MFLNLLKATITSIVTRLATKAMLEWLFLWGADLLVKSTKTPHDDDLLKKVKELLDAGE